MLRLGLQSSPITIVYSSRTNNCKGESRKAGSPIKKFMRPFIYLIGFLLIALLRDNFAVVNTNVNTWATTIHNDFFTSIAKLIADVFETTSLLVLSLIIGAVLFLLKMRENALLLVGAMTGNAVILKVLKTLIYSPRPLNGLIPETGNSFPSGHVTSTVIFFGLLVFFAWKTLKSVRIKAISSLLAVALALFVGFTRIYLNVHWLTDVLAGYFLGAFWLTFCITITPYLVNIYIESVKGQIHKFWPKKNFMYQMMFVSV
jgi:undecaprenyl-diphosphatase